ncbi:DUF4232 domain-containing protein [Streptomyces sp. NPDC048483]|uniref:DUF4232 domain-containing protein n=1 Tax=Streptomyces sp. NPDC048483 TaxID=3154927 RepID=UPI00341B95F4
MSHHTTLRRKATVATLIAAAAIALTACQDSKDGAADSVSPAASSQENASGSGSASGAGSTGGGSSDSGKNANGGNASTAGAQGGGSPASGSGARCTTDHLKAGWGSDGGGRPDMHSDAQQTAAVWLKNTGSSTCSIGGFPGVQIKGTNGGSFDLTRSAKKPVVVKLKPGERTSFTFQLLPSAGGDGKKIEPGAVAITPPNAKKSFQLQWPYGGAILDQSGATHPGTFVNPVNVP